MDRTWSDDGDNPVPPIVRRWQPPTALQDQPAQIASSSSSEPRAQASVKRKEREEVNQVGESTTTRRSSRKTIARIYKSSLLAVSYPAEVT